MMDLIVAIAKWMLVFEVIFVVVFIGVVYGIKIYQKVTYNNPEKMYALVEKIIMKYLENDVPLTKSDWRVLNKEVMVTVKVAENFDIKMRGMKQWIALKDQIISFFVNPQVAKLTNSRKTYKRYYAAHLFCYHYEEKHVLLVRKLIDDPALLISVDASRVGFKFASVDLINRSIDIFSKYRRLQQTVFSTIAKNCNPEVENIIFQRVEQESDPYIKAFCYRLMRQYPSTISFAKQLHVDLSSETMELRIAALNYAAHNKMDRVQISQYLEDSQWQMRATAAKLLGIVHDEHAIPALAKALKDHEWWVRIRAAESLYALGKKGIDVLRAQSPETDKFAYDAAVQVLMADQHQVKS